MATRLRMMMLAWMYFFLVALPLAAQEMTRSRQADTLHATRRVYAHGFVLDENGALFQCLMNAQSSGTLGGVITNEDGRPVPYAVARLVGTGRVATTKADGSLTIVGVAPGIHELSVSAIGFTPFVDTIEVTIGTCGACGRLGRRVRYEHRLCAQSLSISLSHYGTGTVRAITFDGPGPLPTLGAHMWVLTSTR